MGRRPASGPPPDRRAGRRRAAAWAALVALALLAVGLVALVIDNLATLIGLGLVIAAGLAVVAAASWWAFTTRRRWKRLLNIAAVVAVVGLLLVGLIGFGVRNLVTVLGLLLLGGGFVTAALAALGPPPWSDPADPGVVGPPPVPDPADRDAVGPPPVPDPAGRGAVGPAPVPDPTGPGGGGPEAAGGPGATLPARPWLLVNPRSGDGRAGRVGLAGAAGRLGIEVRELGPGEDPERLAGEAVDRGADAIGMAGGDGSLGPVAGVAVERGVPFVCVPVGTRNHFARDLGLVRGDPLRALDAFAGEEHRVDVATVGGRVFLNNVSLGAYAAIVHEPGYRARKLETAHAVLPSSLRGERDPLGLSFQDPQGRVHREPLVLLVSNNTYDLRSPSELGARNHLDGGVLQVSALRAVEGSRIARVLARVAAARAGGSDEWAQWTTTSFQVDTGVVRLPAGVDGEAVVLDAPLEFRIHPRALRVLVPPGTVGLRPTEARLFGRAAVRRLWAVARGREQP